MNVLKWLRCNFQTLEQMKRFSGRLLRKASRLQDIISATIDAQSDAAVVRYDRAADKHMATGYSVRHRHRKRGRKASFMDSITSRISTSIQLAGI